MKLHPVKEAVVVENDEPPPSAEPPSAISSISDDMLREVSIRLFRKRFFPDITRKTWNDWKWQYASRIRTLSGLSRILSLSPEESSVLRAQGERNPEQLHLPFSVTPYYLSLIDPEDSADPIRRTVIPTLHELRVSEGEFSDPLDEHSDSPVPSIVHRYPDRVLFLVTSSCAAYCRYCTRSRFAGGHTTMMRRHWDTGIEYIRNHTQVRDVIVSGGDPLTLSDEELAYLLDSLYRIPHVEMVRLGTKVPMVMPQRITGDLVKMLRRYKPLYMSIHATHPREITAAVSAACSRLADSGVVLGSQTVLLKGVNDSSDTLKRLFHRLLKIRVRPYYLYQCDPVVGTAQFRTTIDEGKEIMRQLRGFTSGYAVPQYIVDTPGGGGQGADPPRLQRRQRRAELLFHQLRRGCVRLPEAEGGEHMLIGLVYDLRETYMAEGFTAEATAEFDKPETVAAVEEALIGLGYETVRIGNFRQLAVYLLGGNSCDLVFNFAEGLSGLGREAQVPALLDVWGIPYTFSETHVLALALHKGFTKAVVRQAGIPTADYAVADSLEDLIGLSLPYPLFVKPVGGGTSMGIGSRSLAEDPQMLSRSVAELLQRFSQPVLIETYLGGREFTVGITGTGTDARALGTAEIITDPSFDNGIYSYHAKQLYEQRVRYIPADLAASELCERFALKAWRTLGCRDCGRIDFRMDENGIPCFLEVNPLAGLHPVDSDLPIICRMKGISYQDLIKAVMDSACSRLEARPLNIHTA